MFRFGAAVSCLERHASTFTLEAFETLLPGRRVSEIVAQCGRASRRRRSLPSELVAMLVVAAGLWRGQGLRNVLAALGRGACRSLAWMQKGGAAPTSAAITRARRRLGPRPLGRLRRWLCRTWWDRDQLARWQGLPLLAVDGTTLRMPDTRANRAHFGSHRCRGRASTAFPFTRVALATCALTHVVLAAVVGKTHTADVRLLPRLLRQIPVPSLLLLDRGFFSYALLLDVLARGHSLVVRAHHRVRYRRVRRLGAHDHLVRITRRRAACRERPDLPASFLLRRVTYRRRGFRPVVLFTSILDAQAHPAEEIAALYRQRWEVELGFDELKTHLLGEHVPLRSKSPALVRQEIEGLLIAYDLVRMHMAQAAGAAGIDARRLSFTDALERCRDLVRRMATAAARCLPDLFAAHLEDLATCRLPARRERSYPRAVKSLPCYYPIRRRDHAA
jgi:hypothetical protein